VGGRNTGATKSSVGPELRNGRPIYRPLTPLQEARFRHEMACCEAVWRQTGEPLAVTYAFTLVYLHAQTIPGWLEEAQVEASLQRRTPEQVRAHHAAMADVMRYLTVRDLMRRAERDGRRLSLEQAYRLAAELLAGTAFGNIEPEQIGVSYRKVRDAMLDGTASAKYFLFTDKRYVDADGDGFESRYRDAEGNERPEPVPPTKLSGLRGKQT
jgi:hypothetical protein